MNNSVYENLIKYIFLIYLERSPTTDEISYHTKILNEVGLVNLRKNFLECDELYTKIKINSFPKGKKVNVGKRRQNKINKKIAVCLSGHLRKYEEVFPSIKEYLIDDLGADLFIHTWDSIGAQIQMSTNTVGPKPNENQKIDNNKIISYFNAKDILIENNQNIINNFTVKNSDFYLYNAGGNAKSGFHASAEPKFIMSQLYSLYKCNELKKKYEKENGFIYDIVLKIRADYKINSSISDDEISMCNGKNIYIPSCESSNHGHPSCYVCRYEQHDDEHTSDVCDVYAYGSSENMDHYCSLFLKMIEINEAMKEENLSILKESSIKLETYNNYNLVPIWQTKQHHKINCFYPERLFKKHLKGYRLLPSSLNGDIKR